MTRTRDHEDLGILVSDRKVVPDPLARYVVGHVAGRAGLVTAVVAKRIQSSPLRSTTDHGKREGKGHAKPIVEPLEGWPASQSVRHLAAVIYAESTTAGLGGENEPEKLAIGATFANRAFYATWVPDGKKRCYNSGFGDGTLLDAITTGSVAVGGQLWSSIVSGQDLKSQAKLEKILKSADYRTHYNLSVKAALTIAAIKPPIEIIPLSNRIPIAFNQSAVGTSSPRWEQIGKLGKHHYFYAFKAGRECD